MTVRDEVNEKMLTMFDHRFVELWWDLKLPGLGNISPNEYVGQNPDGLLDYVKGYASSGLDVDAGSVVE